MRLFKKEIKDELAYEDPDKVVKPSPLLKVVKHKLFIPVVAVVVLLGLVITLKNVLTADSKSEMGYYDTMVSIFSNELGSFSYTFSVETGEKGTLLTEATPPPVEEIQPDSDAEATGPVSNKEFVDWNKYAEVKMDNWVHPVYKVNIAGTTMSVDPLVTNFTVTIATPAYNNKFTEVTVRDDTYYFDVESMYNWLRDSSDKYLISLADEIPHGSKWLEIPASEFAVPSRYAENGDEQDLSAAHSLQTMYRRFITGLKIASGSISGTLGDRGVEKKKDVVQVNLVGDDALALVSAVKGIGLKSGDFYEAVVKNGASAGLYDESQQKQAAREKDNFITAMSDLNMAMQLMNPADLKLQASGQVRQYTNGYGNNQIEGVFGVQFTTDSRDYILKFSGIRSGDKKDIVVPDGSKTPENGEMYLACFNKIVDYFNFTPIKTDVKLSINPDTISESVLDKFIKLVNSTGSAGYHVTRANVGEFIEKYNGISELDIKDENDMKNSVLVADLIKALDKIVPRKPVEVEKPVDPVTPEPSVDDDQYPELDCLVGGMNLHITHDTELSNRNLFVVNVEAINKSEADVTINCSDFFVQDLLASIYPANNETLIRNYDTTFDMSVLAGEVVIPASGVKDFKLYFVLSDGFGHMDLFHGEEQLGAVIQY